MWCWALWWLCCNGKVEKRNGNHLSPLSPEIATGIYGRWEGQERTPGRTPGYEKKEKMFLTNLVEQKQNDSRGNRKIRTITLFPQHQRTNHLRPGIPTTGGARPALFPNPPSSLSNRCMGVLSFLWEIRTGSGLYIFLVTVIANARYPVLPRPSFCSPPRLRLFVDFSFFLVFRQIGKSNEGPYFFVYEERCNGPPQSWVVYVPQDAVLRSNSGVVRSNPRPGKQRILYSIHIPNARFFFNIYPRKRTEEIACNIDILLSQKNQNFFTFLNM